MVLSRLSCCALLAGALGARIKRHQRQVQNAIFIAGTPVLNYNLAYEEHANLAELSEEEVAALEQDWMLFMQPGAQDSEVDRLCKMASCVREGHPEEGGVPYFEVRSTESKLADILHSAKGFVQFVEPDTTMQLIPEVEEVEAASWGLDRIQAPSADTAGRGVHVYVLDTGIRATHRDFGGRVIPTIDLTVEGQSLVECNGDYSCARDSQGHGTHCAGTAAGTTYGVAPMATLHTAKVLGDSGGGSFSWSYDALDWIATKGARPAVASMSLGGAAVLQGMRAAVDRAVAEGVTVVVAGGNSNTDACGFSPAFVPSAITVGSTTSRDARSSFSNYGRCTDIWAPGSSIVSAGHTGDWSRRTLSGTSMACPHVSGAVALVLEANTRYTPRRVMNVLMDKAERGAISGLKRGDTNAFLKVNELR